MEGVRTDLQLHLGHSVFGPENFFGAQFATSLPCKYTNMKVQSFFVIIAMLLLLGIKTFFLVNVSAMRCST